jgi:hypothetical protein
MIAGIGLYGPRKPYPFYFRITVSITNLERAKQTVLDRVEKSSLIKCDGTPTVVPFMLEEPFEVEPDKNFEIIATILPTTNSHTTTSCHFNKYNRTADQDITYYYGTAGKRTAEVELEGGEKVEFKFTWNSSNSNRPGSGKDRVSAAERIRKALFSPKQQRTKLETAISSVEGQIPEIKFYV